MDLEYSSKENQDNLEWNSSYTPLNLALKSVD